MIDEKGLVKNMALCITIKRKKQKKNVEKYYMPLENRYQCYINLGIEGNQGKRDAKG